jgi:hypothetical protein
MFTNGTCKTKDAKAYDIDLKLFDTDRVLSCNSNRCNNVAYTIFLVKIIILHPLKGAYYLFINLLEKLKSI